MKSTLRTAVRAIALAAATYLAIDATQADPLPGRDLLKFSQAPMIATIITDAAGVVDVYGGHDELSAAYGLVDLATNTVPVYQVRFMADDFPSISTPSCRSRRLPPWGSPPWRAPCCGGDAAGSPARLAR